MFSWLCPCSANTKNKQVIQEYQVINNGAVELINSEINAGRATFKETLENIKREMERLVPRTEIQAPSGKAGYSIKDMRKEGAAKTIFRKIQKSDYQKIVDQCIKTKTKWTDDKFNITKDPPVADWKRITDIIPKATFMAYPVKPTQVLQGFINDCSWMSAVAVLAQREYRVKNLFGTLQISPFGIYLVKLFHHGVYQEVIVDDFFPVDARGKLVYAKPYAESDIWVLVLEKAWAKLNGGYSKIQHGYNIQSMWSLTGCPVLGEYITSYYQRQTTTAKNFFKKLLSHRERNHIINCSVISMQQGDNDYGIQLKHSYSVLGIFETTIDDEKIRLFQMRNPIGNGSKYPKFPYNVDDPIWKRFSTQEKDRLQQWRIESKTGDGIFYVDWQTFMYYFEQVSIAQIDDNANYIYDTITINTGEPRYLQITVTAQADFHLIIAQPYIRGNPPDASIRVLVAALTHTFDGQPTYKYYLCKSYQCNIHSNYLDVPLDGLPQGTYIARIDTSSIKNSSKLTLGYYSPNDFAVRFVDDIDDDTFVSKTLLSRARAIDPKQYANKTNLVGANGWCCIENIMEGNFCYVAYHVDATSPNEKYLVTFDESKNPSILYFEGQWLCENTLSQKIPRGQEVLFPYNYQTWLNDPDIFPTQEDTRQLPKPIFAPL